MAQIANIINSDYLVLPLNLAADHYSSLRTCYRLQEHDPLTHNKQINIWGNPEQKISIFKSDCGNIDGSTYHLMSPLHILNSSISGLTKVPDFILFYETKTIIYAIIIELKSHYFTGLHDKFHNGGKIAQFIHSFYEPNRPLSIVNLLFHLPERAIKKPVYYKNLNSIKSRDFGYSCTQNQVYFDELIHTMNLRSL